MYTNPAPREERDPLQKTHHNATDCLIPAAPTVSSPSAKFEPIVRKNDRRKKEKDIPSVQEEEKNNMKEFPLIKSTYEPNKPTKRRLHAIITRDMQCEHTHPSSVLLTAAVVSRSCRA